MTLVLALRVPRHAGARHSRAAPSAMVG